MTTVLVVDDSLTDRRLASGLIEKDTDWTILEAANGIEALQQMELHVPDLVLTDMQMPGMDGLKLVEAAKRDFPLTPVILMTAKGSEQIAVQALKLGAASYVPKRQLAAGLLQTAKLVLAASERDRTQTRLLKHRLSSSEATFVLENDFALVTPLVKYLQQTLREMGLFDESDRLRIGVALEEALLNALYHGNLEISSDLREVDSLAYYDLAKQRCEQEPYSGRRVHVSAKLNRDEAVYVIRDEGPGFDRAILPDPTDPANLDKPSGRGLLLIQTFMDAVSFNDQGNEITVTKRKSVEQIG